MQDDSTQPGSPDNPGWLAKLQQESWQAEILISGGGFLGVVALFDRTDNLMDVMLHSTTLPPIFAYLIPYPIGVMAFLLAQAFILHLILRGYWIGLVGLSLVFPQGVNREKLAFQGKFKSLIKTNSNTPYLIKIDGLCSIIFAFSFFIILSVAGFFLYLFFVVGIASIAEELSGLKVLRQVTAGILMSLGLLALIDFFLLGYLKRVRWISRFYHPIHFAVSWITLSVLYRRLYYSIISNIRPLYIVVGLTAQILLYILLDSNVGSYITGVSPVSSGEVAFMALEDEIVTGNSLRFSFSHFPSLEDDLFAEWIKTHKDAKAESFDEISAKDKRDLIIGAYIITVDSVQPKNLMWASTQGEALIFGTTRLLCVADVNHLARGRHELGMKMRLKNADYARDSLAYYATAYFLIDK